MIELKLTKCTLFLTEQEINSLLAQNPALWEIAIQRGKAILRHEQAKQRMGIKEVRQPRRQHGEQNKLLGG